MSKTGSASIERAADFIWRNARLLERAIFARVFLDGSPQAVIDALAAYRNPDGGFGNALEADMRAPGSTPLACEVALRALHESDIRDPALASGMCEFLASVAERDGRVEIALPHILDYPAPPTGIRHRLDRTLPIRPQVSSDSFTTRVPIING